jgi:preprotein translocase subunit SecE
MNRELRRLQAKEEQRAKERRGEAAARRRKRERVGFRQFLSEVQTELRRVAWPTRKEVVTFTSVTLITTLTVMALTFVLDIGFKEGILRLLELR